MGHAIRHVSFLLVVLATLSFTMSVQVGFIPTDYLTYAQDAEQQQEREFNTDLTGQAEIPSVITNASGEATFTLNEDGDEVSYELDVQDIEGVIAAHIHQGNPQLNGPILVTLYNTSEPTDEEEGTLTEGDFTAEDFEGRLPGAQNMATQNMTNLIDLIEGERTYVNVHTETHPEGELRGTIIEMQEESTQEATDNGNNDDE